MAQTGGPNRSYGKPTRKVRRSKPVAGPPAPKAAGPAGPVAQPKRVVRRVKPAAGPPTGMSGQDRQKVQTYERQTSVAAKRAQQEKSFNPEHLRNAIASGKAKDVTEINGTFVKKVRKKLLPDESKIIRPSGDNARFPSKREREAQGVQIAGDPIHAPVLKVLQATAVPSHKIAGAFGGKNFGEVFRKAGLPKPVAGVAGFAADVGLDPTTYVSFGAGSVAKKASLDAAESAARKAARAGMSEAGQATVAKQAAKRAAAAAKPGKGLTVKFAGKEVPGITRHTATVGRGAKKVTSLAPQPVKKIGTTTRQIVGEFRPTLTPAGADAGAYRSARQAARSTRAFTHGHIANADAQARGLQARIPEEHMPAVLHAIETNNIRSLPDELADAAHRLRSANKGSKRLRKRAGIAEGTVGPGRKVRVPAVTADVQASKATLDAARRELAAQTRLHQNSLAGFGVARGRAQILSRNVGGAKAERKAQAHTVPDTVNQFAGGGHGVRQAARALQAGARNLSKARERVAQLEADHAKVVETARQQRVARGRALKAQERGKTAAQGYVPHAQQGPLYEGLGIVESTAEKTQHTGSLRRPGSARKRQDLRPIAVQNPERVAAGKEPYATDIPLLHVNYGRQTARAAGAGQLEQRLAEVGRVVKPKIVPVTKRDGKVVYHRDYEGVAAPKPNEAIYHVGYSGKGSSFQLREIRPDEWARGEVPKSGKIVIADRKAVEAARQYAKPTQATSTVGRVFDKTTRTFKTVATFTPGFHARNAVGDTQMGYLVQPGHRVPGNLNAARKAVKGLAAQRRAVENLTVDTTDRGTIKIAGKDMPIQEFLKRADAQGILQTGQLTGELRDLGGEAVHAVAKTGKVRRGVRKAGRAVGQNRVVKALTQDRENVVRLATFKHGLDTGLPDALAADLSMGAHIDYADLTEVERKYARRLMPFYTFTARALPLHVKTLVTKPGKFANIEKAREEIGGTDTSGYTPWQQRQFPINVGKVGVTDSLPLTTLNEVPVSANVGDYASELFQFGAGLANPVIRDPVEFGANRSFTFRNDIQDPKRPLVSAPDWVGKLPASTRKELGAVRGPDKKSGKTVWKWPGKVDYALKAGALGPFNIANQLATTGTNRVGQGKVEKAIAGATGVRIQPQDKVSVAINTRYEKLNKLTEKQAALNQQGIKSANATPEYRKVRDQIKTLEREIYALSKKRGDKVLPKVGAPRRVRRSSQLGSGGLSGGGLGSGGLGAGGLG